MSRIIFYDWPYSPFCMKVRAILDYKGLEYRSINPLAKVREITRRGKIGKVPALEIDGQLIVDSTDIAYALDERFPEPALLPDGAHDRGIVHAIEEWADESLYFIGLYYRWYETEGRKPIAGVFGKSLKVGSSIVSTCGGSSASSGARERCVSRPNMSRETWTATSMRSRPC